MRITGDGSRAHNRARLMRCLLERGPQPRQALAQALRLTPASVSRIVAECLAAGLVVEGPPGAAGDRGGPRPVPVALAPTRYCVGAIHLGWFWVDVALFNLQGAVLAHNRQARAGSAAAIALEQAAKALRTLLAAPGRHLLAVGMALNAEIDPTTGTLSGYNALGWPELPLRAWGEAAFGVPVVVDNNVYAMALAASLKLSPPAGRPLTLVNVGSTIGLALVVDHCVIRGGHNRSGFLELVPWPDSQGGWQRLTEVLSDRALLAQARALVSPPPDTIDTLRDRSRTDPAAARLVQQRANRTGTFLAVLAVLHDPALLLLTGSLTTDDLPAIRAAYAGAVPAGYAWAEPSLATASGVPFAVEGAGLLALERVLSPALQIEAAPDRDPLQSIPRVILP